LDLVKKKPGIQIPLLLPMPDVVVIAPRAADVGCYRWCRLLSIVDAVARYCRWLVFLLPLHALSPKRATKNAQGLFVALFGERA
jgi:hypothetical protein